MMGGPSLGLLRLGRRLAGGRLQPVVRMGARGLRIYPSEEGAETVNWDPLHNDSSQLHLDVSVRLLRDLPTALRLLRSFHTTGIYRDGIDLAFECDLGSSKKTRINPPNGTFILPNRILMKSRKVLAVVESEDAREAAISAGADIAVTMEKMTKDTCSLVFDDCITTPELQNTLKTKYGRYLRTKTPSANKGTVVSDIGATLVEFKQTSRFKTTQKGNVRMKAAHLSMTDRLVLENIRGAMEGVRDAGPQDRRQKYIKKMSITTAMGPGISLDVNYMDLVDLDADELDATPFFVQKLRAGTAKETLRPPRAPRADPKVDL